MRPLIVVGSVLIAFGLALVFFFDTIVPVMPWSEKVKWIATVCSIIGGLAILWKQYLRFWERWPNWGFVKKMRLRLSAIQRNCGRLFDRVSQKNRVDLGKQVDSILKGLENTLETVAKHSDNVTDYLKVIAQSTKLSASGIDVLDRCPTGTVELSEEIAQSISARRETLANLSDIDTYAISQSRLLSRGEALQRAWIDYLRKFESEKLPLAEVFLTEYIKEEISDISGQATGCEGINLVITNFVAYSRYVQELLAKAAQCIAEEESLVCFTTVTMPISKWFNFQSFTPQNFQGSRQSENGDPEEMSVHYTRVHDRWEEYTLIMRNLSSSNKPRVLASALVSEVSNHVPRDLDVEVSRYMVGAHGELAKAYGMEPGFPFMNESYLVGDAKRWLLLPSKRRGGANMGDIEPFGGKNIRGMIDSGDERMKPLVELYGKIEDNERAYVIHPNSKCVYDELPQIRDHAWVSLGKAFNYLYNSSDDGVKLATIDIQYWLDHFWGVDKVNRPPTDLFLIGSTKPHLEKEGTNWLCCLAADVDSSIDKLTLELLTPTSNPRRWKTVFKYVDHLKSMASSNETHL